MRIRTIKPEFWASESMGRLTRSARLVFIGLWSLADDEGRFRADPRYIAGQLLPYDSDGFAESSRALASLLAEGSIMLYTHLGSRYGVITGWRRHQKIDKPSTSKLPSENDCESKQLEATDEQFAESSRAFAEGSRTFVVGSGIRDQGSSTRDQKLLSAAPTLSLLGYEASASKPSFSQAEGSTCAHTRDDDDAYSDAMVQAFVMVQEQVQVDDEDHGAEKPSGVKESTLVSVSAQDSEDQTTPQPGHKNAPEGQLEAFSGLPEAKPDKVNVMANVIEVFEHWRKVMAHPASKLSADKEKRIKARLREGYSVDQLCGAIDGALRDEFLMGRDPKSPRKYDGIETLLRDGSQVERLLSYLDNPPVPAQMRCPNDITDEAKEFHKNNTGDIDF